MNKQYSKEEYEKIIQKFSLGDREILDKLINRWNQERQKFPKPATHNISAEDCSGEYILNSKNCHHAYILGKNCEDCRYIVNAFPALKDSLDCTYSGENASLLYECIASGGDCYNMAFCNLCFINCSNLYYCSVVTSSKNCFGCISLTNNEYCILNKKYSQQEYEQLVPKIITHMKQTGEWGKFFPAQLSPFGYNETVAQDFLPLSKQQAQQQGFNWKEEIPKNYQEQKYIGSYNITEAGDNITHEILACNQCRKNFKITSHELKFHQKHQIAIPNQCFDCRHQRRLSIRTPYLTSNSQ